ncbi:MAG: aromatic amino acid lyase, partial [Pseudomonadota bacterium]
MSKDQEADMSARVMLNGSDLTLEALGQIAGGAEVGLAPEGLTRMQAGRAVLVKALEEQRPMYGITTGLGPRVVERLSPEEQQRMSVRTIRGRAHSVGTPLPRDMVRAAMAVRANTLLLGGAGADPAMAHLIVDCLNAGLTPVIGETGSIGAADLMWGGNMGLALIGEGKMHTQTGQVPAAEALTA